MYFCPRWDEVFYKELEQIPRNSDFFLSGTMVQPFEAYINLDCGSNINNFNVFEQFLNYCDMLQLRDQNLPIYHLHPNEN